MADEVNITVDQVTEEVTINVTNGGGMGTVTSVAIQGTDGIQVDSGSPIISNGVIVLGLSPTVLSQLSLAGSSLQPGDNISELVNNVGFLESVQAGSNISIDSADPLNPVISATGMGTGTVTSVGISGTDGIEVDSGSPVISSGVIQLGLSTEVLGQLSLASSALQNITGLVTAGSNISITGGGTSGSPYEISSTGSPSGVYLEIAQNLADLNDASVARDNLALGPLNSVYFASLELGEATSGEGNLYLRRGPTANPSAWLESYSGGGVTQITSAASNAEEKARFPAKGNTGQYYIPMVSDPSGLVNLPSEVSGLLPDGNISSAATWNAKQDAITGAATTIVSSNLTPSRLLVSDGSGKVSVSSVTSNEAGYLSGSTSSIQTQINGKAGLTSNTFTGQQIISQGVLTGSAPLQVNQTWNNGGANLQAIQVNVTNTASAGGSNLLELNVAGSQVYQFRAGGQAFFGNLRISGNDVNNTIGNEAGGTVAITNTNFRGIAIDGAGNFYARNSGAGSTAFIDTNSGAFSSGFIFTLSGYQISALGGGFFGNSVSSATNYEGFGINFSSNVGKVGTVVGSGGGTTRDWDLIRGAVSHATIGSTGVSVNTNLSLTKTITPAGTTGAQSINTQTGTVNFAAGATSLVVTNSLVTTSSIILPVLRTNDASALIDSIVPASGSFTIYLSSAATAETSVGFVVL